LKKKLKFFFTVCIANNLSLARKEGNKETKGGMELDNTIEEEMMEILHSADGSPESLDRLESTLKRIFDTYAEHVNVLRDVPWDQIRDKIVSDYMEALRRGQDMEQKLALIEQVSLEHPAYIQETCGAPPLS
jgi:hypothetical protein